MMTHLMLMSISMLTSPLQAATVIVAFVLLLLLLRPTKSMVMDLDLNYALPVLVSLDTSLGGLLKDAPPALKDVVRHK